MDGKQSGQIYLRFTNEIKIVAGGGERSLSSVKLLIIRVVLVSARRCSDVLCEAGDKRTRRSLARHLSAVSSSFLSSIVADHLAEADCVSTFF